VQRCEAELLRQQRELGDQGALQRDILEVLEYRAAVAAEQGLSRQLQGIERDLSNVGCRAVAGLGGGTACL
jgi:hypothetical protein